MQATGGAMKTARAQRRARSLPEMLLWRILRQARRDVRFRSQHPIGPYVADFYCPKARLVIEIDGATHEHGDRAERDAVRDEWMRARGLRILRIPARDVLADPEAVANGLYRMCKPD